MSNTRSSSFSSAAASVKAGLRQSIGRREGACRLPSRMPDSEPFEPLIRSGRSDRVRGLRHARIHVAVLVRLAGDGRLEIRLGLTDRQTRRRITDGLEVLEMAVRV